MPKNPLPEFFELLREAQDTVNECDDFDVHSDNPASAAEFAILCQYKNDAVKALVDYVKTHADAITEAIACR